MRRIITFGDTHALLTIDIGRAVLKIAQRDLPVELADAIDNNDGIDVKDVFSSSATGHQILTMDYNIDRNKLLEAICDAITKIFRADIAVSNAPTPIYISK